MRQTHQQYDETSNNSNFLYWNLHYHNLYNFCIDVVSHTCIPNEEVSGSRNVYLIYVPTIK